MARQPIDKNSREYLTQKVNTGRHSLLLIIIFTVINLFMIIGDTGRYFLFSASIPYELTFLGALMTYQETGAILGVYTYTALVISAAILALYLLCWLLSKKRAAWYVVALVLFALDTLFMVYINLEYIGEYIMDIVFHVWVLWELWQAISAGKKLKNMPPEQPDGDSSIPQPTPAAIPEEP